MRTICVYGKGGIGKSTISSNTSVCLAESGLRVMQLGCDPKADSTFSILGRWVTPILSKLGEQEFRTEQLDASPDVLGEKFGIQCMEVGGPRSGRGCAGRGIVRAIGSIKKILKEADPDVVVMDVLGDIVCGGLTLPMWSLDLGNETGASEVYIVSDGDFMTIYAANRLVEAIRWIHAEYDSRVKLGGIICNAVKGDPEFVQQFARAVGSEVIAVIERSPLFVQCGLEGIPIVKKHPDSQPTAAIREIARRMWHEPRLVVPTPLGDRELDDLRVRILGRDAA